MVEGREGEIRRFLFSYYFIQAHKGIIDEFIILAEKALCECFSLWPSIEIEQEGFAISYPIITAWKSTQNDTRIVFVEDQSYKYGSKIIALFSCTEAEKPQIQILFKEIDKKISKIYASSERELADKNIVAWLKKHAFILAIFGFTGITGSSLILKFSSFAKSSTPSNSYFDVLILILTKVIAVIILGSAACFLIIIFFRIIRVLSGRKTP
ncbi:MAG: hypothetical protein IMZ50_04790 [Candidatus Atribacteria bacterium]|nr:hypothetical protein [Candidatus Atribacteria bacterium]